MKKPLHQSMDKLLHNFDRCHSVELVSFKFYDRGKYFFENVLFALFTLFSEYIVLYKCDCKYIKTKYDEIWIV